MNLTPLLAVFDKLPAFAALRDVLETPAGQDVVPLGLPKAARPPLLAKLIQEQGRPVLLVTARVEAVPIWLQEVEAWLPADKQALRFPEPTPLPYERAPWSANSRHGRLHILSQLMGGQHPLLPNSENPPLVITSARALLQQTLPKRNFIKATSVLRLGQIIDLAKLEGQWAAAGYEKVTVVERPGQFSQRGGILDIFPAGAHYPMRIELFGDEVDTLRLFDPDTQRTVTIGDPPERVLIPPAREAVPADAVELGHVLQLDSPPKADELPAWQDDIAALAAGRPSPNGEFYLPLIYSRPDSLLHYLPDDALVVVDDWVELVEQVKELHEQAEKLEGEQTSLPTGYPNPLFLWEEIAPVLTTKQVVVLGEHVADDERPSTKPLAGLAEGIQPGPRYGGQMRPLMLQLKYALQAKEPTVVVSRQAQRLAELWRQESGLGTRVRHTLDGTAEASPNPSAETAESFTNLLAAPTPADETISFVEGSLGEGFGVLAPRSNDVLLNLLTDAEIFGWNRPAPRARRGRRQMAPETHFADIQAGDYVVHAEYGVGQFVGLVVRSIGGTDREYLQIQYANTDVLYVPVHHADRLSKWVGSADFAPSLHRLGDKGWTAAKQRAQRDIDELADELLELYAAREEISGHAYGPDTEWQAELEASFPYQETDDQLRAIADVKADMGQPRPMDRLICGDVGYGKTEVALRAAFKAVMDEKQVAVVVPTTVLAQQHYNTFSERLQPFPVKVAMLSRFRTQAQQQQIIDGLKSGAVDIVIGTHRLFSDDVSFKDLGLIIIDEEQRFGVTHKEKLKQLRTEVDVLTMTATPIPRTMHMAVSGLRDISTINTAPSDRLPVQTYVGETDDNLIRRAILRELDRGGQVYFVHNRVQSIQQVRAGLEKLVPEAIIGVGHGQMSERELEAVMTDFAAGAIDVLLCTTIIESGLDIPNANTLIVNQADQFGLSQLYQLRGRVGRGAHRAYAYFFHRPWRQLTPEAQARLETIAEATDLGAGYTIAMRDLEIRGAGELLGPNQSGHIAAIGFDLYTRMLAHAVRVRKAVKTGEALELDLPDNTLIDLPLATYIPTDYVPSASLRLRLYRRMAGLVTLEDIDAMAAELLDRFGPIPDPLENLLYQLRVKLLALEAGVTSVTTEARQIRIQIPQQGQINPMRLQRFIHHEKVRVSRRGVWLMRDMPTREWQIALVQVLEKLQQFRKENQRPLRTAERSEARAE